LTLLFPSVSMAIEVATIFKDKADLFASIRHEVLLVNRIQWLFIVNEVYPLAHSKMPSLKLN
ncbi:MAG TPA: hypothetical protein VN456_12775, partial [Desulfosporosinus sp.]|nr:hypothetical protein [Desulfosporosinus sp.]